MTTDVEEVLSTIARMRAAVVDRHPSKLAAMVTDIVECALECENFQNELLEDIEALTHEGRQGELEQANVGLADENRKLHEELDVWKNTSLGEEICLLQSDNSFLKGLSATNRESKLRLAEENAKLREALREAVGALEYAKAIAPKELDDFCSAPLAKIKALGVE